MTAEEPRGDLADQADATIAAAEREAIEAALAQRAVRLDGRDAARMDHITDEPDFDMGSHDDSDDPAGAGGDDIALLESGAPTDPNGLDA